MNRGPAQMRDQREEGETGMNRGPAQMRDQREDGETGTNRGPAQMRDQREEGETGTNRGPAQMRDQREEGEASRNKGPAQIREQRGEREAKQGEGTEEEERRDDVPIGVDSSREHNNHDRPPSDESIKDRIGVVNLSNRHLTDAELSLLGKGLSFVPTKRQTVAQLVCV